MNLKKTAVVLGGTHDHIGLIEKLQKRGYYTILVDYLEHPSARDHADQFIRESTLNQEAVLNICIQYKTDAIFTACIDQALLTMAYVCEKLYLPCHLSYESALNLTDKSRMKKILFENGIPTAKFKVYENGLFNNLFDLDLKLPLIVKPVDANSSKGVTKIIEKQKLPEAVFEAFEISRSKKVIIEEYCEGEELSIDIIIKNKKAHILLITKNRKIRENPNHFTICQNVFEKEIYDLHIDKIQKIAEKIALSFGLNDVPILLQVLVNKDEISVIEFSSRIGGGSKCQIIDMVTKLDILEYFIDRIEGKPSQAIIHSISAKYASMNYIYTVPGTVRSIQGVLELKKNEIIEDFFEYKTMGAVVTRSSNSSDRIAGFLIKANDKAEHQSKCDVSDDMIQVLNDKGQDIMLHGLFSE